MRDLPWSLHTTSAPLGHKGVSDAKQICDAGGIKLLHICPATNNLPTRMTRAAWATLCAATQRKARERECIDKNQQYLMRMTKRLNVCALCQGKTLPLGLEFIEAAEMAELSKPKEEAMAKQSKLGVCENCGDKGALTGSFGRRVCSTCLRIRSNVNSNLPKIATAARDMGKGQELLAALVPDGGGMAIQDMEAELLQEISGIVGYTGEDPAELVEAVRQLVARPSVDCGKCTPLRVDLLRACGLETEDTEGGEGLDTAVAAALQEIAHLTDRREFWASAATKIKVKAGDLKSELLAKRGEIEELRSHIAIGESQLEKLRAELTLAQQARDEWEQRCAAAEESTQDMEAELYADDTSLRDDSPLLDVALAVIRDEPVPADRIATLIDLARRASA